MRTNGQAHASVAAVSSRELRRRLARYEEIYEEGIFPAFKQITATVDAQSRMLAEQGDQLEFLRDRVRRLEETRWARLMDWLRRIY